MRGPKPLFLLTDFESMAGAMRTYGDIVRKPVGAVSGPKQ